MTTANKLTILRVFLIPVFMVLLLVDAIPLNALWALIVFAAASFTDLADGYIARHYNQVTTLGKFLDPLADKLLVLSALIVFVDFDMAPGWAVFIIVARELMVTAFRIVANGKGIVIAADMPGKIKTTLQLIAVITMLAELVFADFGWFADAVWLNWPGLALLYAAVFMTVLSGVLYVKNNWAVLKDE